MEKSGRKRKETAERKAIRGRRRRRTRKRKEKEEEEKEKEEEEEEKKEEEKKEEKKEEGVECGSTHRNARMKVSAGSVRLMRWEIFRHLE